MGDQLALNRKFSDLLSLLREYTSGVLAFSGGVDSSFLLKAMKTAGMKMLAVTAVSETMPRRDKELCESFAAELEIEHIFIGTDELSNESFVSNTPERCFFCKDELFRKLKGLAQEGGLRHVFDGSNSDDLEDYRPGRKAAALHGVKSPLAELGFSKNEIRILSKELGLKMWDRPSSPCLSSRFPYGRRITSEALLRVENAEEFIRGLGIGVVRVRNDGDTARIEVDEEDMPLLLAPVNRRLITDRLRSLGYVFVSVDLEGYRSGKMNKVLDDGNGAKSQN